MLSQNLESHGLEAKDADDRAIPNDDDDEK
jgi:hypothetical protein